MNGSFMRPYYWCRCSCNARLLLNKQRSRLRLIASNTSTLSPQPTAENDNNYENIPKKYTLLGCSIAALIGTSLYYKVKYGNVRAATASLNDSPGSPNPRLPYYSLDEVSKHGDKKNRIWVTYKQGVYDVTDFVEQHPGGDQILLAAGSSVDPFWSLYAIHKNQHVLNILEGYRIGNLKEEDADRNKDISDPYGNDPRRHVVLKPASVKPFNAETPLSLLTQSFITPREIFYVRNHLPVPQVDPETYELEIEVDGKIKTFTLEDLKKLPKHTVVATVMCSGNRRSEMTKVRPVKGLSWDAGAVGNASWSGPLLRDVLKLAGLDGTDGKFKHVQFEGLDLDPTSHPYGASIPYWKAVDERGDVLLAYEMNGETLPADHGFPVRVVVPGTTGARNVKWLSRIVVSDEESHSHWQRFDYKGFSPSTNYETVDYSKSSAIQEMPVTSAICSPLAGDCVKISDGHLLVKGYAWSGGGRQILRVDVTVDGGKQWHVAELEQTDSQPPQHWAWTLWTVRIPVDKSVKNLEIWSKAVDSSYNVQPESFDNIWNFRGVLCNAYHRVPVKCVFT